MSAILRSIFIEPLSVPTDVFFGGAEPGLPASTESTDQFVDPPRTSPSMAPAFLLPAIFENWGALPHLETAAAIGLGGLLAGTAAYLGKIGYDHLFKQSSVQSAPPVPHRVMIEIERVFPPQKDDELKSAYIDYFTKASPIRSRYNDAIDLLMRRTQELMQSWDKWNKEKSSKRRQQGFYDVMDFEYLGKKAELIEQLEQPLSSHHLTHLILGVSQLTSRIQIGTRLSSPH